MATALLGDFTPIARGLYLEGLAVDQRRDVIWYSDVVGGGIHAVRPDGTAVITCNPGRAWTGGVLVNHDGAILSSGQGGIMWNDPDTGAAGWLVERIDGKPINGINEMIPDGAGGLYFGTVDLDRVIAGGEPRPTALYHLTRDAAEPVRVADAIGFSNGLAFDAARRVLYCNDTFRGTWAFTVPEPTVLSDRCMVLDKEDADGMALTGSGELWITGFRSGGLTRLAADGARLDDIPTPAGAITQVRFGGPDLRDCYLTTVPATGGETLKDGGTISEPGSTLYRARSAVPGLAIGTTRFTLR